MKSAFTFAALAGCLFLACTASAETLYVIDHITVPVYSQATLDGDRVAVIHTGDAVELLAREAEAAQVRLVDGAEGWINGALVGEEPPAAARVEALQAENERLRAAARSGSGGASELKSALDQARAEVTRLRETARAAPASDDVPLQVPRRDKPVTPWRWILTILAIGGALGLGFWWGYRTLERRVLAKYGGLKVY